MMRSLFISSGLAAAAFAALAAGQAAAQAAEAPRQTVTVTGEAPRSCTLGAIEQAEEQAANFDPPAGSVFPITRLADPETLSTRAARIVLTVPAMCNGVHRVVLGSDNNGLWRQDSGTAPAGFATAAPYQIGLTWADQEETLAADAVGRRYAEQQILVARPTRGDMEIAFEVRTGDTNAVQGAPLVAGEYSDVLRLTVEPQ